MVAAAETALAGLATDVITVAGAALPIVTSIALLGLVYLVIKKR